SRRSSSASHVHAGTTQPTRARSSHCAAICRVASCGSLRSSCWCRVSSWPPVSGRRVDVVDGFEQLSWARRAATRLLALSLRHGLLVTAHAPIGLQRVFRTAVTPDVAVAVVARLLERAPATVRVRPADVLPRLRTHGGNLREALFDLYDAYQAS